MILFRSFLPVLFILGIASCEPAAQDLSKRKPSEESLTEKRARMVEGQILARGIRDPKVIRAMETVPRHQFIPEEGRPQAYEDSPVPIGHGQTISQPYIVALMSESLEVRPGDKVLEIGTGSGYQAAVLEFLGAETYSVEIVPGLAESAKKNLEEAGYPGAKVKTGDGWLGWPEHAPYDAVIVTCAPDRIPPALIEQLKEGGRIVIPVGPEREVQELFLGRKVRGEITAHSPAPACFIVST